MESCWTYPAWRTVVFLHSVHHTSSCLVVLLKQIHNMYLACQTQCFIYLVHTTYAFEMVLAFITLHNPHVNSRTHSRTRMHIHEFMQSRCPCYFQFHLGGTETLFSLWINKTNTLTHMRTHIHTFIFFKCLKISVLWSTGFVFKTMKPKWPHPPLTPSFLP